MELMKSRITRARLGYTVTELLVGIGICTLIAAIALPAIARARESARLVQCKNNLHQIGVALQLMASSKGVFPTASYVGSTYKTSDPYGIHERLLPALEAESALEARINYRGARVPAYLCPNDDEADKATATTIPHCYRPNTGDGFRASPWTGFQTSPLVDTRTNAITDGLSNTVAFSERLWTFSDTPDDGSLRLFWWTSQRFHGRGEESQAIDQALNHRTIANPQAVRSDYDNYDHMLPPNSPSSYNGPDSPPREVSALAG